MCRKGILSYIRDSKYGRFENRLARGTRGENKSRDSDLSLSPKRSVSAHADLAAFAAIFYRVKLHSYFAGFG